MSQEEKTPLEGSDPAAWEGNVAADARSVVAGGDIDQSAIVTGDRNIVTVIYQGVKVVVPSPEAVAHHRAALRKHLEARASAHWGGMSVYIQEEGATLPIEASPYQTGRLGPKENLLQILHAADRLLVLGEPGSGKTVSLERLAWELCAGPQPVVPVWLPLFLYAGTPLRGWMRSLLQETGRLRLDEERALSAFLKEDRTRCFFLFDGLNEVSPPYRDRLVDELIRWMAAHPRHPVVLTSRTQDELWRRLRREMRQIVVVQPISDDQARAYLVAHLGRRGDDLYKQLGKRLREMARTPLILWLIKQEGTAGESIPGNRGELYARFVSRMLERDTDRRMDAEIPELVKREALAGLAYHLGQDQRLFCSRDEAVGVVAQLLGEERAEKVVGACGRHGLLAGEEMIQFAPHHTVQEHFAACALERMATREWQMGRWRRLGLAARRILAGKKEGLAALAAKDWWMETFIQLAGLVDDTDRLVQEELKVNPWLAWWCLEEGRDVAKETQEAVADRSIRLLESKRLTDRRRAVATLAQMRSERTVRPLLWAAADLDAEVTGLAVQVLTEMGEAAQTQFAEALRSEDRRLWLGTLQYLMARPDDPLCAQVPERVWGEILGLSMIWMASGQFLMGGDRGEDLQAYGEELFHYEVTLPGCWIGQHLVTVAQFRAFVEESRYQGADKRSLQGPEHAPVVYVSWNDALAFCRWLNAKTGLPITLPSEAEWEKAAQGMGTRASLGEGASHDETQSGFGMSTEMTEPMGQQLLENSPCGWVQVPGNVWEWTRSLYGGHPYDPGDGREDLETDGPIVLRGGAFYLEARSVRGSARLKSQPNERYRNFGFRVVISPHHL